MSNHQWKLYQNSKLNLEILQAIQDLDGELPEDLEKALNDAEGERDDIIEDAICTLKNLDALSELHAAEMKRLAGRKAALEARSKTLHNWLSNIVTPEGFSRGVHSAKWGKCPPSLKVIDPALVPIEFIEYEPKLKTEAIKTELKAERPVPGCELVTDKRTLRIK